MNAGFPFRRVVGLSAIHRLAHKTQQRRASFPEISTTVENYMAFRSRQILQKNFEDLMVYTYQ
jgi:hypothetical protein